VTVTEAPQTPPARFPDDGLRAWAAAVLEHVGFAREDAAYIADSLVDANLRGVDSHGVMRLPVYLERVALGHVDPTAMPSATGAGAMRTIDGMRAAGQLVARLATSEARSAASLHGIGAALARRSAHFGAAGYFARQLAHEGCIGIVMSNSESIVVPHGGADPVLGTNPIAVAAPTSDGAPVSLDMATSAAAMGRVMVAATRGEAIPADWGVDADGRPTTDPNRVVSLVGVGGPKGYALGLVVELLAGVLTGAAFGTEIGNMYRDRDRAQDVGHFVLAIDIEQVMPFPQYLERLDHLLAMLRGVRPAPGSAGVLLPGEPEERRRTERLAHGIPLERPTASDLRAVGERLGIAFVDPLPTGRPETR
jgi:ureidoglycolate dehydrogenase (NAD+)